MAADAFAWIRAKIRAKIASGFLPVASDPIGKLWVGKGSGRFCDGCDQPITNADSEHEIGVPTGETIRFHRRCLAVWRQAHASW